MPRVHFKELLVGKHWNAANFQTSLRLFASFVPLR
jgi:hypothetical protein